MTARFHWLALLGAILAASESPASAQNGEESTPSAPGGDKSAASPADRAFSEGQAHMKRAQYTEACAKFAESQRLEGGIGTLLWLGECFEKTGKVASAHRSFMQAAALARARADDRESVATSRASRLDAAVPRLTLQVQEGQGLVTVDGAEWARDRLNVPERIDPGTYEVVLRAAQGDRVALVRKQVSVASGQTSTVLLEPTGARASGDRTESAGPYLNARRGLGLAIAGLGLVSGGVSLGFGFAARSEYTATQAQCTPACRDEAAYTRRDAAYSQATVATVGVVAGIALLSVGTFIVLWPSSKPSRSAFLGGFAF
jgi:hypothetical protein